MPEHKPIRKISDQKHIVYMVVDYGRVIDLGLDEGVPVAFLNYEDANMEEDRLEVEWNEDVYLIPVKVLAPSEAKARRELLGIKGPDPQFWSGTDGVPPELRRGKNAWIGEILVVGVALVCALLMYLFLKGA